MTCQACGHEAETVNGEKVQPHNFGCRRSLAVRVVSVRREPAELSPPAAEVVVTLSECEHDGCSEPKKPWSGKGAKPKYCTDGHK